MDRLENMVSGYQDKFWLGLDPTWQTITILYE